MKEAVRHSNFSFAEYLLKDEPKSKKADNPKLNPFLHAAAGTEAKPLTKEEQRKTKEKDSKTAILDLLLSKGADIEGKNEHGYAPIVQAYGGGLSPCDYKTINWMKERGAQEAPDHIVHPNNWQGRFPN